MSELKTHGPNQMTRLLIELPLATRQRLHDQANKLQVPQVQLIRTGIHQFLDSLEAQEAARAQQANGKPTRGRRTRKGGAA